MLKIIQKRLSIELSEEEASHLQQSLQSRYNSLLYRIRLEYLNRLGLDVDSYSLTTPPTDATLSIGELFMPEPGAVLYLKSIRHSGQVEAGVITSDATRDFGDFFDEVREALAAFREAIPAWEAPAGFAELEVEDSTPGCVEFPEKELSAARTLIDKQSRSLLESIQTAGSIFSNRLDTGDRQDTAARIQQFKELQLLNMDYAVLCRRTGQQILRVADRATIDESSQKAFKCFICGNQLSDEVIEEVLTCTEACTELLKNQKWLLVLVQGILGGLGISSQNIRIYKTAGSPTQIIVSLNGQRYLFALCTSTIDLDQAYIIGAHISAYHLDHAIVVATEKVTTLMHHHLTQTNPSTTFHFIEDLADLDTRITGTLQDTQRQYLQQQLAALSSVTPIDVAGLVLKRMVPEPSAEPGKAAAEAEPSEPNEPAAKPENEAKAEPEAEPAAAREEPAHEKNRGKKGKR